MISVRTWGRAIAIVAVAGIVSAGCGYPIPPGLTGGGDAGSASGDAGSASGDAAVVDAVTVDAPPDPHAKGFASFKFLRSANPALSKDVTATISGTTITAELPFESSVASLVPTFAQTGAGVTVGAASQESGATAQDFASPVTYTVTAVDGTSASFVVTVKVQTFAAHLDVALPIASSGGFGFAGLAVVDLDGDGAPDLITGAGSGSGSAAVLLNQTAQFSMTPAWSSPVFPFNADTAIWIATADFNADGKPDVVINNGTAILVYLNTTPPDGKLAFAADVTLTVGSSPIGIAIGDIDHDGKPDIVVANSGASNASVLLDQTPANALTATFASQALVLTGAMPKGVAVADVDGDGKLDIVTSNATTAAVSINSSVGSALSFVRPVSFTVGGDATVVTADLNGDTKPDIVTANFGSTNVSALLDTTMTGSAATYAAQVTFPTGEGPYVVVAGDLDSDGRPDILTPNFSSNNVSVLLDRTETSATTPAFLTLTALPVASGPLAIATGDLNRDGELDLVVECGSVVSVILAE